MNEKAQKILQIIDSYQVKTNFKAKAALSKSSKRFWKDREINLLKEGILLFGISYSHLSEHMGYCRTNDGLERKVSKMKEELRQRKDEGEELD